MMKPLKIIVAANIIFYVAAIMAYLAISAMGYSTVLKLAPPNFDHQESTSVNVSCAINVSGFPYLTGTGWNHSKYAGTNVSSHIINVTILNKSSSSGAYGILASSLSLTVSAANDTAFFWNYTATLTEGDRHFIICNFTNVSRNDDGSWGGALTGRALVQIDADATVLGFSGYNMSFVTADGTTSYCGVDNSNAWSCSG